MRAVQVGHLVTLLPLGDSNSPTSTIGLRENRLLIKLRIKSTPCSFGHRYLIEFLSLNNCCLYGRILLKIKVSHDEPLSISMNDNFATMSVLVLLILLLYQAHLYLDGEVLRSQYLRLHLVMHDSCL